LRRGWNGLGYPLGFHQAPAAALQIVGMDLEAIGDIDPRLAPFTAGREKRNGVGMLERIAAAGEIVDRLLDDRDP
jgi:hypothetical protein